MAHLPLEVTHDAGRKIGGRGAASENARLGRLGAAFFEAAPQIQEVLFFKRKSCKVASTILLVGVTLGMSPQSTFTTAKAVLTSFQRGNNPSSATWGRRLLY